MPYKKGRRKGVSSKVAASTTTGALTVMVVWGAGQAGLEVPPEVASAFTVVLAGVAGWFKSEREA